MPQPNTFLSVRGLSHTYHTKNGETPALKDIHFDLFTGEFAAIIGPSGCGKSTLLELIAGLIPLQKGSLRYPFLNQPPSIGYMLQKDHLLEYRTIYKNIILGLEIQHRLTEKNLEYVPPLFVTIHFCIVRMILYFFVLVKRFQRKLLYFFVWFFLVCTIQICYTQPIKKKTGDVKLWQ